MLSQKDAVHKAISSCKLPDESFDRHKVVEELMKMFKEGQIHHGNPSKIAEEKALRDYCGSVLSNWTRKDKRLGGTNAAVTRATKKKVKPADDEMKRLMQAKVILTTNGADTQEIDKLINERTVQLELAQVDTKQQEIANAEAMIAAVYSK